MSLYKVSDKIVFNTLNNISFGFLEITNYNGEFFRFGNPNDSLKANLVIKNPNFTLNLIRGGSVGFAESYMDGDFNSSNLTNLLLLAFRNENDFLENLKSNILF